MAAFLHYYKKIFLLILLFPFRIFKIKKNRVLLINDLSYNYSCNPKYIAEYLRKTYPCKLNVYYSVKDVKKARSLHIEGVTFIRFNSIGYFYYAMTAKVLVSNSGGYSYLPLKKKQIVINTHHGGGANKKIGRYVFGDSKLFRKDLKLHSKRTHMYLSTCKKFTEVVSDSILVPKQKFWEIGMPRNDMLLHAAPSLAADVKKRLGLLPEQHLVLYAPTYRKVSDNYFNDSIAIEYGIRCEDVCNALQQRFGGEWVFGYRLHPCVVNRNVPQQSHVMDLSDYPEMQELLLVADVMINDFSSSMWDFMLTGKPLFTFAVDMEHYIATTNLETPVSEWPFPQSTDNAGLTESILRFDEEKYKTDCRKHYEALGGCESGHATQSVGDYIYNICYAAKSGEKNTI